MKTYTPFGDGTHTAMVTFQYGSYKYYHVVTINGNIKGKDVVDAAIEDAIKELDEDGSGGQLIMTDANGKNYPVFYNADDLEEMVTSVEITSWTPKD